jgi:hypothetical protein
VLPHASTIPQAPLNEVILDFHAYRRADAGESEDHQPNQRAIAQADHGAGIDGVEQRPRSLGRKVRLKIGDIEAEAQSEKQVQRLLEQAEEFQKRQSKMIHEP